MNFTIKMGRGESLCDRCKYSTIVTRRTGDRRVYCAEVGSHYGAQVPPDVTKCNSYLGLTEQSEYEFEKIAWMVRSDKSGKVLGFEPPKKEKE